MGGWDCVPLVVLWSVFSPVLVVFFVVVFLWWFLRWFFLWSSFASRFTDNRAQQNNARFQQHNMWQQMYGQSPSASRQPESPVLGFQVRRTHLLEDAMSIARKLMVQNSHGSAGTNGPRIQDLKKPLKIKFHNEAGRLVPVEHSLFGKIKSLKGRFLPFTDVVACFFCCLFLARCRCGGGDERIFSIVD